MSLIPPLATILPVLAVALLLLWGLSLARNDVSIVDIFWGLGFGLVAATGLAVAPQVQPRGVLALVLALAWGVRLAVYLARRNLGKGEDFRYQAMRERVGPSFRWRSLFTVFWLQGALMAVVSLPLQAAVSGRGPSDLGPIEILGVALWAVGVFFEAVGDAQLARFKADPAHKGRVMDQGLWRYTRHPNYFGDFCVWWGFYLLAVRVAPWTIVGPALMSVLLIRVSGVALLEKTIAERRPEYGVYIRRTSAFFPWWPRESR